MDITQIDSIIAKGDIDALLIIATALQDKPNQKEAVKQYDPTYRDWETDRKSTRLNSSHITRSRMPSSA